MGRPSSPPTSSTRSRRGSSTRSSTSRTASGEAATVSILDADKVTAMGIEVLDLAELGWDELVTSGISREAAELELRARL